MTTEERWEILVERIEKAYDDFSDLRNDVESFYKEELKTDEMLNKFSELAGKRQVSILYNLEINKAKVHPSTLLNLVKDVKKYGFLKNK